jgi:hypothetical protein
MGPRGFRGAQRRGRRRGLVVGAAVGSAAARRRNDDAGSDNQGQSDQMEQLQKLGELRDSGILTEDEFQTKKKEILGM